MSLVDALFVNWKEAHPDIVIATYTVGLGWFCIPIFSSHNPPLIEFSTCTVFLIGLGLTLGGVCRAYRDGRRAREEFVSQDSELGLSTPGGRRIVRNSPEPSCLEAPGPPSSNEGSWPSLAITEYNAAVSMMTYESNHFWTVFTAFLIGQTLLATLLVNQFQQGTVMPLAYGMLAAGVLLCVPWWIILERARYYVTLRIRQARELEFELGLTHFRVGRLFAEGTGIAFDDEKYPIRAVGLASHFGIRQTTQIVPWLFFALFGFIGWQIARSDCSTQPAVQRHALCSHVEHPPAICLIALFK